MARGTNTARSKYAPGSIAVGTAVSVIITIIAAAIFAALIESGKMSPGGMGYAVMIILMVSSLTGSLIASKQSVAKKMIISALTAACYFVVLLCITALFFDGAYKGIPATALVVATGGIIAGLIPIKQGSGVKVRKRNRRYG